MEKGKIYKGGCPAVYKQHQLKPSVLEYSEDNGLTWTSAPMDLGKINYFTAWFRRV